MFYISTLDHENNAGATFARLNGEELGSVFFRLCWSESSLVVGAPIQKVAEFIILLSFSLKMFSQVDICYKVLIENRMKKLHARNFFFTLILEEFYIVKYYLLETTVLYYILLFPAKLFFLLSTLPINVGITISLVIWKSVELSEREKRSDKNGKSCCFPFCLLSLSHSLISFSFYPCPTQFSLSVPLWFWCLFDKPRNIAEEKG